MRKIANEPITGLPIPEKSGYCFDGWYMDDRLTQEFYSDCITDKDMTLFAKWLPKTVLTTS